MRAYLLHGRRSTFPKVRREVCFPAENAVRSARSHNAGCEPPRLFIRDHFGKLARLIFGSALLVLGCTFGLHAQVNFLGLRGHTVSDLSNYWNGKVYVATDQGVFVSAGQIADTSWTLIGLKGKSVLSVYPHEFGPLSYAVTAGVQRSSTDPDSTLIYCSRFSDSNWVPADTGIDRAEINAIRSIDGFPSPAICGETFAGGGGKVYMGLSGIWKEVFDIGIGIANVVKIDLTTVSVWAGGETALFAPFIARSNDKGSTWATTFPDLGGDNACNSLCFDPADTSLVYGGMEGTVIKSTDGGMTWSPTALRGTPYYFYGLAYDAFTGSLFAGGTTSLGEPGLFVTKNHGTSWNQVYLPPEADGILCMTVIPTVIPEQQILLIGTITSGVLAYTIPLSSAGQNRSPYEFTLEQNYPNPFNPSTTISYELGETSSTVQLAVFDLLGRHVATLVEGKQDVGSHAVAWDGAGQRGNPVSSGMYVYRLIANGNVLSRTMILLR